MLTVRVADVAGFRGSVTLDEGSTIRDLKAAVQKSLSFDSGRCLVYTQGKKLLDTEVITREKTESCLFVFYDLRTYGEKSYRTMDVFDRIAFRSLHRRDDLIFQRPPIGTFFSGDMPELMRARDWPDAITSGSDYEDFDGDSSEDFENERMPHLREAIQARRALMFELGDHRLHGHLEMDMSENEVVPGEEEDLAEETETHAELVVDGVTIDLTPEEDQTVRRLVVMGFDYSTVVQVYFACGKDEEVTHQCLLSMR
jgi:hypothetical protein